MTAAVTKPAQPIDPGLGKHMAGLNEMQRAFVYALVENGGNATQAALAAGYGGNSGNAEMAKSAARVRGYQLTHTPKVQEAIQEEARKRLLSGALMSASALIEIVSNPEHKDRFRAAKELLAHSGMVVQTEHKLTVDHIGSSDKEMIDRVKRLAANMGLDPVKLLGSAGVVIDADFTVIEDEWAYKPEGR